MVNVAGRGVNVSIALYMRWLCCVQLPVLSAIRIEQLLGSHVREIRLPDILST